MVMKLEIGQTVELHARFKSNLLNVEYDDVVFKGKVVSNPKWLDNDYVSVHTGTKEYPTSYIHKRFIVGFEFSKQRSDTRVFKVKSKLKGSVYNVISGNGKVSCDCVGFQFRRDCKHVKKIKEFLLLDTKSA